MTNWNDQPVLRAIDYFYSNLSDTDNFSGILAERTYTDGDDSVARTTEFYKHENVGSLSSNDSTFGDVSVCIFLGLKTDGSWEEGTSLEEFESYILIDTIFKARTHALAERECIKLDHNIKQALKTIRRAGDMFIDWMGFVNLSELNNNSSTEFVIRSAYKVTFN